MAWLVSPQLAWGALAGLVGVAWAAVAHLPVVVVALIAFAALTLGTVFAIEAPKLWRARNHGRKKESTIERREKLDHLLYPPRDDRRELGEECADFAMKMRVFNEEQEWKREKATAHAAQEIREADPELSPQKTRQNAEVHVARIVETSYGLTMRNEALRLFDQAREQGAIAARSRRTVERPLSVEMSEIPNLFVALARRLDYDPPTSSYSRSTPEPEGLPQRLDSLMREGIDLVDELNVPVEPEKLRDGWKLESGVAPEEWWDKADDFSSRIRTLLIESHPALLTDYRDGYNSHVRTEKAGRQSPPGKDERSDAEKMLDLANFERSGPRRVVEASLEGLAAARHRLGVGQSA